MDYIVKNNGNEFIIETTEESYKNREILYENYKKLIMDFVDQIDEKGEKILKDIAFSLTEDDARSRVAVISEAELSSLNRVFKYAKRICKLSDIPQVKKIMEPVYELFDASMDDEYEDIEIIRINGNEFSFNPEKIDIKRIIKVLDKIGEEYNGNHWTIESDKNGEITLWE